MRISINDTCLTITTNRLPPIFLYPAIVALPAFLVIGFLLKANLASILIGLAIMLGTILSIFLHEVGHVLAAQHYGLATDSITLVWTGGIAEYEDPGDRAIETMIVLAGPATNLVVSLAFFGLIFIAPLEVNLPAYNAPDYDQKLSDYLIGQRISTIFEWLGAINLGLFVVNMLPAYPLDGGTILHNQIAPRYGDRRACIIVGSCGVVLGVVAKLVFVGSLLSQVPILIPPSITENWDAVRRARRL